MIKEFSAQKIVFLLLFFIGAMIAVRFLYSGEHRFLFLIWNLFLAWLPLIISTVFEKFNNAAVWKQALVFVVWLLFFPNSIYIITDLVHLKETGEAPLWYDALLLFAAAVTGLVMAFISLYNAETFLQSRFNNKVVQVQVIIILLLGSFGVYLGRFLRWNSWDVLTNPFSLFYQIIQRFIYPFQHSRTWSVTFTLAAFLYLLWLAVKKIPGIKYRASSL